MTFDAVAAAVEIDSAVVHAAGVVGVDVGVNLHQTFDVADYSRNATLNSYSTALEDYSQKRGAGQWLLPESPRQSCLLRIDPPNAELSQSLRARIHPP